MNDQPNIKMNDDHKHIQLPSGAIANVSPDASPELLGALDTMAELAIKGAKAGSIRSAGSGTERIRTLSLNTPMENNTQNNDTKFNASSVDPAATCSGLSEGESEKLTTFFDEGAAKCESKTACWIEGDESCEDYCYDCVQIEVVKEVARYRRLPKAKKALNAILCLYKNVWKKPLAGVNALRSKRRKVERHAPSVEDISKAFSHVKDIGEYPARLILHLLYGAGLRVGEGIAIRIKDVDFGNGQLFIHDSKHHKDRYVAIPETLIAPLRHQVEVAAMKARIDIANRLPVQMPDALHKKYINAAFTVPWHYLFPKIKVCKCPRRKISVRYHVLDSTLQRCLKRAVETAGLMVPFTPHHLRHSYATHLINRGESYKGVSKSMGHASVLTTFNYDHSDALGVGSPLDQPKEIVPFPPLGDIADAQ